MEIDQSDIDLEKRIIDLEAQCEQLKEDKNSLVEQMMDLKDKEANTNNKYVKWKRKSVELKEKLDSEGGKWKEELERSLNKYRELEVEKRLLQIDFEVAQNDVEGNEKLRAEVERLQVLLEEAQCRIATLEAKFVVEAKKQKMEEEKKIFELCQMIQDLERKKGGTGRSFHVHKVVKSVKKNTKLSRKKKKITELVDKTQREKSEGEKSAIFPHSHEQQQGSLTYGATIDSKNEDNTMTTSANCSMRKRASPGSLSGGDRSTR